MQWLIVQEVLWEKGNVIGLYRVLLLAYKWLKVSIDEILKWLVEEKKRK